MSGASWIRRSPGAIGTGITWGLVLAGLWSIARPLAAQTPGPSSGCAVCHEELEFLRQNVRSLAYARDLVVEADVLASSAHTGMDCGDCHEGFSTFPHAIPPFVETRACSSCHAEARLEWGGSVHSGEPGGDPVADCRSCHGTHDVARVAALEVEGVPGAAMDERCGACHEQAAPASWDPHGARVACVQCHGSHGIPASTADASPVSPGRQAETCGACHEEAEDDWAHGSHGRAPADRGSDDEGSPAGDGSHGEPVRPTCGTCHAPHEVREAGDPEFTGRLSGLCTSCHHEYGDTYLDSYHGQANTLGSPSSATCVSCHSAHEVLPASDEGSMVSEARLVETCAQCHPAANASFVGYAPHADHNDREKYPVVYWTYRAMTLLLIGVFTVFGIHTALWLLRLTVGSRNAALLVLVGAGALLTGCGPEAQVSPGDPSHPDLACAACHAGELSDRTVPASSSASCASRGCHADGGPPTVSLAGSSIPHRGHGEAGGPEGTLEAASCVACHGHSGAGEPLETSMTGCFLCHGDQLRDDTDRDCRFCHGNPPHPATASQGAPLPAVEAGSEAIDCARCHFQVSATDVSVGEGSCEVCHRASGFAADVSVEPGLHADHPGVGCTACHEAGQHQVGAPSSVVSLQCGDCHSISHGVEPEGGWITGNECDACHGEVHRAQQALFLGYDPGRGTSDPSFKFLAGMTCTSCHTHAGGAAPTPADAFLGAGPSSHAPALAGQGSACESCHSEGYDRIPLWWARGGAERAAAVRRYLEDAERTLGAPRADTVGILLGVARESLELVEEGGAQHNLDLSDRLLRESLDYAGRAYQLASAFPAAPPDLGMPARPWFCSYCHYTMAGAPRNAAMPPGPHDELRRKMESGRWTGEGDTRD